MPRIVWRVVCGLFDVMATFVPTSALAVSTAYSVAVSGLRDWTGNLLTPFASTFTTRAVATTDTTAPTVLGLSPPNGASGVAVTSPIVVTLSEPIVASAVTAASMPIYAIVSGSYTQVAGSYSVNAAATELTFLPVAPYPGSTLRTAASRSA